MGGPVTGGDGWRSGWCVVVGCVSGRVAGRY